MVSVREAAEVKHLYKQMAEIAEADEGLVGVFDQNQSPVYTTLKDHAHVWKKERASALQQRIVEEGLRLKLAVSPSNYHERNNQSFEEEQEFGMEAIRKLVEGQIVKECDKSFLACINPLTVAHRKGKKRLCIDLSRCINLENDSRKFKIESATEFAAVVMEGDYMWAFDLKSAYHQVAIHPDFWKYLGFSAHLDGEWKFFHFVMLPFGLNSAAYVLTKLLKFPVGRWRKMGVSTFCHLDDGIGAMQGRVE